MAAADAAGMSSEQCLFIPSYFTKTPFTLQDLYAVQLTFQQATDLIMDICFSCFEVIVIILKRLMGFRLQSDSAPSWDEDHLVYKTDHFKYLETGQVCVLLALLPSLH